MTRTATGAELAVLEALEPEALIGWEAEILNIREAIDLSRAITERRVADAAETQATAAATTATAAEATKQAAMDLNTITIRSLPTETQDALPPTVRETYDPDFDTETP